MLSDVQIENMNKRKDNVLKHISIFDLLSRYNVEHRGRFTHQISCPFPENHSHGDTKKSCRVYEEPNGPGHIYCFACMEKPLDPIGFTMAKEGKAFMDTIRHLEYTYRVPTEHLNLRQDVAKRIKNILSATGPCPATWRDSLKEGELLLMEGKKKLTLRQFTLLFGVADDLAWDVDNGRYPEEAAAKTAGEWMAKVKEVLGAGRQKVDAV